MLKLSKWQKVVSVVWFFGCELVLPIADVVTDFMFAAMLYELWNKDIFTHEDSELIFWSVALYHFGWFDLWCSEVWA